MGHGVSDNAGTEEHAPWLAREKVFSRSEDRAAIARIIQALKENHVSLLLVAAGGEVFQRSLLTNINDGLLQIDKPLEWRQTVDSWRVYFQDKRQTWYFFRVDEMFDNPFSLSVAMPEELSFLPRRRCQRIKLPVGTRALVKKENAVLATVFVRDLSAAGMLMFNDPAEGEYATDSIISDIVVSLPPRGAAGEVSMARKVLPLIGRGRIVRSFIDPETLRPCYGVSFHHDSNYVKETISLLVSGEEGDVLPGDCPFS